MSERRGPLVLRSAQWGGAAFLLGSIQFLLGMGLAQWRYPGYSDLSNAVSDLGSTSSPWAWVFNDSIRVLGFLGIFGAYLFYRAFAPRRTAQVGVGLLIVASLGAIGVGSFPEGSPELGGQVHALVSLVTFLGSGLALVVLSLAMVRDTRWDGFRLYTLMSGVVTLVALALFIPGLYGPLGLGGLERVVIAPILLWAIAVGVHLNRFETYDPRSTRSSTGPSAE